jgi:periplasmic divalent cation tolerance protein
MIVSLVTCADGAQAETIARALVDRRLAACVHIMPPHKSVYRWQGKAHEGAETNILIKTRAALFAEVEAAVMALHSYDVPCIVSWEAAQGHAPFMAWVDGQTEDPQR